MRQGPTQPLEAVIAGGGAAGLEATLALRELAGGAVSTTMVAPEGEVVYRPMTVREPFGYSRAPRYSLQEITDDLGVELIEDRVAAVDAPAQRVRTADGRELSYDALLLGVGARAHPAFEHAITIDDRHLDEQLHGLIQDFEQGYVSRLAFIAPSPMPWPLPMYELALMVARRAYDMNVQMSITIATPEEAPLALFGSAVSEEVERVLTDHGILVIPSAHCEVPETGLVEVRPGTRSLHVDRIVALPQLLGPLVEGVPKTEPDGFIPVDEYAQVHGLDRVWGAGDATDFPVKMGGIAAQQADVAAVEIANLAGLGLERQPFEPELHAVLLGAEKPLYLDAHLTGGHGMSSRISDIPSRSVSAKIAAKYLAPYLRNRDMKDFGRVAGNPT